MGREWLVPDPANWGARIDWVITGGESDYHAPRPCNLDWVRDVRDQCVEFGVSFFHKQHGGARRIGGVFGGRELDGRTWEEFPVVEVKDEMPRLL
jgi:protein gp37